MYIMDYTCIKHDYIHTYPQAAKVGTFIPSLSGHCYFTYILTYIYFVTSTLSVFYYNLAL